MAESRTAHEAAATYLSVATLRTHEQAAVIRDLSPEYRRYYDIFAIPLDGIARSSFVRYAIGQKIAALAFHSPLLRRVAARLTTAPRALAADDSPNARLTRLLALFRPIALQSLIETVVTDLAVVAAAEGSDGFDANDEAAWLSASPKLRIRLDAALEECIHTWLNNQECDLSVIDPEEARALVPRLLARAKRLGAFVGVVDGQFLRKFWPRSDGRFAHMELMNAESVLFNEPTMNNKTVEELPDKGWPVPRKPSVRTVVVGAHELYVPDTPNDWYVCLAGNGGCGPLWSLSQARLDAFCKDRRQAWRELGGAARDNDLYVLGLPAPITVEPENWTSMALYAAMQMFRIQEDAADPNDTDFMGYYGNLERLVVYMHGNMMSWVNWFDTLPGPRYCGHFFGEEPGKPEFPRGDTTLGISLEGLPMGIGAHLLRCDLFPITFMRLGNPWAFRSTNGAIATFATRTKDWKLGCPEHDEDRIHQLVETTVAVVETTWRVF